MRIISAGFLLVLLFSLVSASASGQKPFREGTLVYTVTLDPPDNQEGVVQYTGTYTLTVKDNRVRRELKMDNGFNIVMLYDERDQSVYTLREMQGKKYAIQVDPASVAKKRARYEQFTLKEKGADADIAGLPVRRGTISYKDGTTKEIFFSKEWAPEVALFEQLPGIKVLPLVFQSRTDDGLVMHFRAQKVSAEPVETGIFKIPQDFKVMSSEEYKQMLR